MQDEVGDSGNKRKGAQTRGWRERGEHHNEDGKIEWTNTEEEENRREKNGRKRQKWVNSILDTGTWE